jgi:hypothetical protein
MNIAGYARQFILLDVRNLTSVVVVIDVKQMFVQTVGVRVETNIRSDTSLQVRPGTRICMNFEWYARQLILLDVRTLISVIVVIDVMQMSVKTLGLHVQRGIRSQA